MAPSYPCLTNVEAVFHQARSTWKAIGTLNFRSGGRPTSGPVTRRIGRRLFSEARSCNIRMSRIVSTAVSPGGNDRSPQKRRYNKPTTRDTDPGATEYHRGQGNPFTEPLLAAKWSVGVSRVGQGQSNADPFPHGSRNARSVLTLPGARDGTKRHDRPRTNIRLTLYRALGK